MTSAAAIFSLIALALVAALAAGPATALTFREEEFTCPIDGEKFTARVVTSGSQFGMRLDLKPLGALMAPIPLPVCPTTGFVMFKAEFTAADIARLKPIVSGEDYQRARREHTPHYLAALMRERTGADDNELSQLYLRASWEAEGKPELAQQYRALTLRRFDAAMEKDAKGSPQWWTAAVIGAEMLRQLGRFEDAERRLDSLPVAELAADSSIHAFITQIREHSGNRHASPVALKRN